MAHGGDTAQSLGVAELPLPASLVAQSAMQFGHASFGEPAWPLGHRAGDTPFNYLQALWTPFRRIADRHGAHALDWPVIGALALQRAILASAQALEPALALRLVLETAVPMSRVHLALTATGKGAESPKPPVPQR